MRFASCASCGRPRPRLSRARSRRSRAPAPGALASILDRSGCGGRPVLGALLRQPAMGVGLGGRRDCRPGRHGHPRRFAVEWTRVVRRTKDSPSRAAAVCSDPTKITTRRVLIRQCGGFASLLPVGGYADPPDLALLDVDDGVSSQLSWRPLRRQCW